jgi:hypothetical protein
MTQLKARIVTPQIKITLPVGAPGPPGPPGGQTVDLVASGPLISGRVVVVEAGEAAYFQKSDPAHAGRAFGVLKTSASAQGQTVVAQLSGLFHGDGLALDPEKPVWVGDDGALSPAPPPSGIAQMAGAAKNEKSFTINFQTLYTNF